MKAYTPQATEDKAEAKKNTDGEHEEPADGCMRVCSMFCYTACRSTAKGGLRGSKCINMVDRPLQLQGCIAVGGSQRSMCINMVDMPLQLLG